MTLYQRLGGQSAISLVVEKFYQIMLKDQRVAGYFTNTDMKKQVARQKQFITLVTGGPNTYEGTDMKAAHCKHAIGQFQFDSTWENLQKALDFYNVPPQQKMELKDIFYSVQDDIVNSKKQEKITKCPFSKKQESQSLQKENDVEYKSLCDKLGGKQAISLVVDKFYELMLNDKRVKDYFSQTDMKKQKQSQKEFITMVTGGPNQYHGTDMKTAHCKFAIGQEQFDATWENLQTSLIFYNVPKQYQLELKQIFYSVQDQIVNRKSQNRQLKCPFSHSSKKISQQKQEKTQNLCQKLGGKEAINLVVDKFYDLMLQDERVKDYFYYTDMEKQRKSQKQFITMVTGGPNQYHGSDMKTAHCKFAIGQFQFDSTWQNLQKALDFYKVQKKYQTQLKEVFYSVQDDIVNSKSKVPLKGPYHQKNEKTINQNEKQNLSSYLPLTHNNEKKCPFSGTKQSGQGINAHMKQYFKRKIRLQFLQREQKQGKIPQKLKNSVYQNIFY